MANLGSTDTPAAAESLDLPNGYSPAFEEESGDLVINDTSGNTALRWDDTNGKWQLAAPLDASSNDVTNVGALDTEESVTVTGDAPLTYGRNHGASKGESVAVGVGSRTLYWHSDGYDVSQKVAVGHEALKQDEGLGSVGVGFRAAADTQDNVYAPVAVGYKAAEKNQGEYITALGYSTASDNTGNRVTAVGYQAAYKNTGEAITALGFYAARNNTRKDVTAIGYTAAKNNTGQESVFVGRKSGRKNTGNYVTALGYKTAGGQGLSDPSTMGNRNVGVGAEAIENNQASGLICLGFRAGKNAQTDDQLIITQRDGTRRLVMDLTTGDLSITGELTENASL